MIAYNFYVQPLLFSIDLGETYLTPPQAISR
jgi:hypothetical protein